MDTGRGSGLRQWRRPKRHETDAEPVSLYVFKTVSDPFAGRISYFKVFSGVLKNDATLQNFTRGGTEKLAHISIMQGKTAVPVTELHAGDIGAVAKLKDTLTGDTLGDKSAPIQYPQVKLPSRPSPSPSSPRPAPTKTSWAPASTS